MLITIIILTFVSYLIYIDAKSRGMKAAFWSGFTFFTMILAVPIYFVIRKPKINQDTNSIDTIT